jgi:hypothetical protein
MKGGFMKTKIIAFIFIPALGAMIFGYYALKMNEMGAIDKINNTNEKVLAGTLEWGDVRRRVLVVSSSKKTSVTCGSISLPSACFRRSILQNLPISVSAMVGQYTTPEGTENVLLEVRRLDGEVLIDKVEQKEFLKKQAEHNLSAKPAAYGLAGFVFTLILSPLFYSIFKRISR